jgi:hypothetical protein
MRLYKIVIHPSYILMHTKIGLILDFVTFALSPFLVQSLGEVSQAQMFFVHLLRLKMNYKKL